MSVAPSIGLVLSWCPNQSPPAKCDPCKKVATPGQLFISGSVFYPPNTPGAPLCVGVEFQDTSPPDYSGTFNVSVSYVIHGSDKDGYPASASVGATASGLYWNGGGSGGAYLPLPLTNTGLFVGLAGVPITIYAGASGAHDPIPIMGNLLSAPILQYLGPDNSYYPVGYTILGIN